MTTPAEPVTDPEAQAVDLIRALCVVAGDEDAVLDVMRSYARDRGMDALVHVSALALVTTYSRCLASPVALPDAPNNPHHEENR